MRQTYRVMASLIALGVLVQASAVAFGWFQVINDVENGAVLDQNAELNAGHIVHGMNGMYVMPLLGLLLLGVSFAAARSVPKARKWAGIVFVLIVLQVALALFAFGIPILGALHGINALLIFGAAARAGMLTRVPTAAGTRGTADEIPAQRRSSSSGSNLPV
jgi:cytochrome bd-type quinol oxidase subunit 2